MSRLRTEMLDKPIQACKECSVLTKDECYMIRIMHPSVLPTETRCHTYDFQLPATEALMKYCSFREQVRACQTTCPDSVPQLHHLRCNKETIYAGDQCLSSLKQPCHTSFPQVQLRSGFPVKQPTHDHSSGRTDRCLCHCQAVPAIDTRLHDA